MKKEITRYVITILLACSLLASGCARVPIPRIDSGDDLPADTSQSEAENGAPEEEQEEDSDSTDLSEEGTAENDTSGAGAVRKESFDWLKDYVPVSTEPITVRRWNVTPSKSFDRCCEIYEKYTGIHVNLELYSWDDYKAMLDNSFENGRDPGIVRIHPYFANKYIDQGNLMALDDLLTQNSLYLKPESVNREPLSTFVRDDKLYGINPSMSCSALWYNKKLFDEKGMAYPDETWTWEDVADAAAALNDPENEKYGISLSYNETEEGYYNIITAYNGNVISEDSTRSGFDQEETLKAMQLTADLIRRGMPPVQVMEQNDQMSLFCSGKTAMAILGSWQVYDLMENEYALENLDCTILPYAAEEKTRGGVRTISGYSIASGCERAEDYWHFMELLYCYDRISGPDSDFSIPIDPAAVKSIDIKKYPFAIREAYIGLLHPDETAGDTDSSANAGQAVKNRIVDIPCSMNTEAWLPFVGTYMKKAWNDPDKMEEYCLQLAGVMNYKLEAE